MAALDLAAHAIRGEVAGVPQKKLGLEVTSEKVEGRGQVNSHHMIVVGTDRARMALAANRLAEVGGGVTFWRDGQGLVLVELPIVGLMSDRPAREVADKAQPLSPPWPTAAARAPTPACSISCWHWSSSRTCASGTGA